MPSNRTAGILHLKRHSGIATIVIVVALVLVFVAAGAAYLFLLAPGNLTPTSGTKTSETSTNLGSTVITRHDSTGTPSGSQGFQRYQGTFSYSLPLGPAGERVNNDSTVDTYRSIQVASGSFTFFINPANFTGVGTGHGTLTVTTSGFCSGTTTVQYTFSVINANDLLGGNITVAFGDPTPSSFMVPLTCTGSLKGVDTSVNNPSTFLGIYPNLVSVKSVPITVSQQLSGNITYSFTITPTG